MTRHAAIDAAELRIARARRELHGSLRHLRRSLSQPSCLAAAALLGFALGRRDGIGVAAGMLAKALLARGAAHLMARSPALGSSPVR
jgi:hypothetical protein